MFETSQSTEKLDEALAKVQGEIEFASKDKTNPAFKSRYADLTSVWDACRSALAKHGVSVTQWPIDSTDGRVHLMTRVAFKGEYMKAIFSVPVLKQDAQGFGSALTYLKRYMLSAALGIVADEDDDGNAASQRPPPPKNFAPQPRTSPPPPKPEVDPLDAALAEPGDYVVKIGPNKGKAIKAVGQKALGEFTGWFLEQEMAGGFSPNPDVKEYFNKAMAYLEESSKK